MSGRFVEIIKVLRLIGGLPFPDGTAVGSLPAGAGDAGSGPGLGGSRMPRCSWACGPRLLSLRVWGLCSAAGGAAAVGGRSPLSAAGAGGPRAGAETQRSQK